MTHQIHAGFWNVNAATRAVGALIDHKVPATDISVYAKDNIYDLSQLPNAADIEAQAEKGITTSTPSDAAKGAMVGAEVGMGLGVLAAVAALVIPGVGLVLGGGALATAVGGALATTAGGAVAGGAMGYLKDLGVDEDTARTLSTDLEEGQILVIVTNTGNEVRDSEIRGILAKYQNDQDSGNGQNSDWQPQRDDREFVTGIDGDIAAVR